MVRLPSAEPDRSRFTGEADAFGWIDAERRNLIAAIQHTADHGPHRVAWRLADALRSYLIRRMALVDWQAVAEAAVAAADAGDDDRALAAGYLSLGGVHDFGGHGPAAIEHYTRAIAHARRGGWPEAESSAQGNIGSVYIGLGRLRNAADACTRSLEMYRALGRSTGEATQLDNPVARRPGADRTHGGRVGRGDPAGAVAHGNRALAVHGETGYRLGRAQTHLLAARAHRDAGRTADAERHERAAAELFGGMGADPQPHAAVLGLAP